MGMLSCSACTHCNNDQLKLAVLGHAGHDLVGSIAWNEQALDSAAAYCRVPMSSSVDLASQTRQDGIQYRVGIHQASPGRFDPFSCNDYCLAPLR